MRLIVKRDNILFLKHLPNILWPVKNMKNVVYIQKKEKCIEDYGWPKQNIIKKSKK